MSSFKQSLTDSSVVSNSWFTIEASQNFALRVDLAILRARGTTKVFSSCFSLLLTGKIHLTDVHIIGTHVKP